MITARAPSLASVSIFFSICHKITRERSIMVRERHPLTYSCNGYLWINRIFFLTSNPLEWVTDAQKVLYLFTISIGADKILSSLSFTLLALIKTCNESYLDFFQNFLMRHHCAEPILNWLISSLKAYPIPLFQFIPEIIAMNNHQQLHISICNLW